MAGFPTPHLDKLERVLENEKLPGGDKAALEEVKEKYKSWIAALGQVAGSPEEVVRKMVGLLNDYRLYLDVNIVFDSEFDFLYRQKGQLKLDNSVVEEFLPRLVQPNVIPELAGTGMSVGPVGAFSSLFFVSSLEAPQVGGGMSIRTKDQDFAISKPLYIRTSHSPTFEKDQYEVKMANVAYVAAECKTNLDKTMFQEACATARDTKFAVAGARYYLLAEWLDMTPLSTASTEIDEVLLLRKAKRINSNIRSEYARSEKRKLRRQDYVDYLTQSPFRPEVFQRLVDHIRGLLRNEAPEEHKVLELGYF